MHKRITGTQCESVGKQGQEIYRSERREVSGLSFFLRVKGDGDGLCERRVETGTSREDRVCDGQRDRKEVGEVLVALQEHVRVELVLCHQVQEYDNNVQFDLPQSLPSKWVDTIQCVQGRLAYKRDT